jgi:copper chaperone CopZ
MTRLLFLLSLAVTAAFLTAPAAKARGGRTPVKAKPKPPQEIYVAVSGMTWVGCPARVTGALKSVKGVTDVSINSRKTEATVTRKAGVGSNGDLEAALKDAGYGGVVIATAQLELRVNGLECGGCETKAEKAIEAIKGTRKVSVSKLGRSAKITYETKQTSPEAIMKVLKKAGFPATKRT